MSETAVSGKRERLKRPTGGSGEIGREPAARLRTTLLRFLEQRTGDRVLAEDLTQEALLRVLRGLPGYRGASSLATWGRKIALNVWRDHLRRAEPRGRGAGGLSVLELLEALEPPVPGPDADDELERRATRDCLLGIAGRLAPEKRRLLVRHDLEEVPIERLAREAGCSAAAMKVRLHRARKAFAEICREDCIWEPGGDGPPSCTPGPRKREPRPDQGGARRGRR